MRVDVSNSCFPVHWHWYVIKFNTGKENRSQKTTDGIKMENPARLL